jgi:hypothetical protein
VAPLILDGNPQVEPVQRDPGVGADRQPIAGLGDGRRSRAVVQPPEVIVRIGERRAARESPFVGRDRAGWGLANTPSIPSKETGDRTARPSRFLLGLGVGWCPGDENVEYNSG